MSQSRSVVIGCACSLHLLAFFFIASSVPPVETHSYLRVVAESLVSPLLTLDLTLTTLMLRKCFGLSAKGKKSEKSWRLFVLSWPQNPDQPARKDNLDLKH
jgi:hypothetical protein